MRKFYTETEEEMEDLIAKLKEQVIEQLNLEDMSPEDIDAKEPLFGDGLGLDSIDALELIVLLEREYGIKINDPAEGKKIFVSIETMANYIQENQNK